MELIAHRGLTYKHLENSKEAIMAALEDKTTAGVEFDVRITYDKKFVVIHDINAMRHFNDRRLISEVPLSELRKLDYKGYKISTLEEVLESIETDKIILVEMKVDFEPEDYVVRINKILKKYKHLNFYVGSFKSAAVKHLKKINKDLKVGILRGIGMDGIPSYVDFVSLNYYADFSKEYLKQVAKSTELFLWTVNKCIEKIDARIITNDPHKLVKCK